MNTLDAQTAPAAGNPVAREESAPSFCGADKALVPGMLICGFFYWEWILSRDEPALGVSLFTVLICAVTLLYFRKRGLRQNRESLPYLAVICLSGIQFAVFDTTNIQFFNLLFLSAVYLYWVAVSCGTRLSARLSANTLFDMAQQCFITPFANFSAIFSGLWQGVREMRRGRGALAATVGLIVFLPLLSLVLSLLTEADAAFDMLWQALLWRFYLPDYAAYVFEFVLGVPVAAYLYGAVFGNAAKRRAGILDGETLARGVGRLRLVPSMAFYAPLAVFNAVYALFFVALGNYFFSAFVGRLPEAVSYAEYARKGFFELCGVATVNLALIAVVCLLIKRGENAQPLALRVMTGLMSAFTVLLILTAVSKMLLYISSYGLTRLRVYTSWFMLLLLIAFSLLLLWHFRPFNLAKTLFVACAVCFMALTWTNTDGLIAKYNIEQYESGKTETLDVLMLASLSAAAAPYLYDAWQREQDPQTKEALRRALSDRRFAVSCDETDAWNIQSFRAALLLEEDFGDGLPHDDA